MQNKILIILIIVLLVIIGIVASNRSRNGEADADQENVEEAALGADPLSGGLVAGTSDSNFVGVWSNNAVPKYVIELSPEGIAREYYAGKASNVGSWNSAAGSLTVVLGGQSYVYQISSVSSAGFELVYPVSGQALQFSRVR